MITIKNDGTVVMRLLLYAIIFLAAILGILWSFPNVPQQNKKPADGSTEYIEYELPTMPEDNPYVEESLYAEELFSAAE